MSIQAPGVYPGRVARECKRCSAAFSVKRHVVLNGRGLWCSKTCARRDGGEKDLRKYIQNRVTLNAQTGCWDWTGYINANGYGVTPRDGKNIGAHRLSYLAFRGPIPDKMFVCHHCDNRRCCNPDHLFIGTHKDNMSDMAEKGRASCVIGMRNPNSRLTDGDVRAIRTIQKSAKEVASDCGVSVVLIHKIRQRRVWSHIND